ncbi:hypothetical protein MNBD_ALPHA06-310 [hydrothermal vent metagenome]|uniref:Uncharacterized protein n=1 Tax=hydrothermal vent metagenome TaxID=652676 RepID=A0A3B0T781_9ZZZZ
MQDLEHQKTRNDDAVYIGIDVSKTRLDIFILPSNERLSVTNDRLGHNKLTALALQLAQTPLIVMEATGRYHRAAFERLSQAGLQICIINPYQTYSFGKAMGQNTKTDTVDAYMLACFAMAMRPSPKPPLPKRLAELKELVVSRRQFTVRRTALSNQIKECCSASVCQMMRAELAMIKRHIAKCDTLMKKLLAGNLPLKARFDIIISVPGVGFVNAVTLLAEMAELGDMDEKQAAALLGVAPHANQSGNHHGKSRIKGGRKAVRNVFYMAALSSVRMQGGFQEFHQRLIAKGKPYKVAITAVMRKMIILINTLLKQNRKYQPKHPLT